VLGTIRRGLLRPQVAAWLEFSPHSWKRHVIAHDTPHLHAPGMNPDRILVTGDGAAAGRGVRTHELGLPGFLARSLSSHTRRATDVELVVDDDMTVTSCQEALENHDLGRFDVVLVALGANEALALMSPREWQTTLRALLVDLRRKTPVTTAIFLLAIPEFGINPHFPAALARAVDYHVGMLNTITEHLADELSGVEFIPEGKALAFELEGIGLYKQWADTIAARIARALDPRRPHAADLTAADEVERQLVLEELEARHAGADAALDAFTDETRRIFGVKMAAITFIRSDTGLFRSASGFEVVELPRSESFCDVTIRRDSLLVIEDAARDARFADFSVVSGDPGIRFYAGHPLESPGGQRVGALCVMDTEPRHFTADEAVALRMLAQRIQTHLFAASPR
jgi:GAF domain-containing protein